jgi:hypothetical protein
MPGFDPNSVHRGFVLDGVAMGRVSLSPYFGFNLSVSFHRCPELIFGNTLLLPDG